MRGQLAALLLAALAASSPLSLPGAAGPEAAAAQEPPTLRLSVSQELDRQMTESPGELAWEDVSGHLTVEYAASDALPLERVPVELVAVAVRDGEILGRASTSPSVATADEGTPGSAFAGPDWPPAERWFPSAAWRPDGLDSPTGSVAPEPKAVASQIVLPSNAGGVVIYAAPSASELRARFRTLPVVITTRPKPDTASADTTGL